MIFACGANKVVNECMNVWTTTILAASHAKEQEVIERQLQVYTLVSLSLKKSWETSNAKKICSK